MNPVQISVVGLHPRPDVVWPEDWPPPRLGEEVYLSRLATPLYVRTIVWYPEGDSEEPGKPFVYVVLGPRPPGG